jgi:hypothetical protein
MHYLHDRQDTIEDALAARHLAGGTLVLYDVSSAAFEGRTCPLGAIGHPKDGVRGRLQIIYGLLTFPEGIPVAIEVSKGNTGDPTTVAAQVTKVTDRRRPAPPARPPPLSRLRPPTIGRRSRERARLCQYLPGPPCGTS